MKLNRDRLSELGLERLPEPEASALLQRAYSELELRIGVTIADEMTAEQLDEFEGYFKANDDASALSFLEREVPNYQDIVRRQLAELERTIEANAKRLLAAAGLDLDTS